jgi:two-component system CheB/CheR fusion protein
VPPTVDEILLLDPYLDELEALVDSEAYVGVAAEVDESVRTHLGELSDGTLGLKAVKGEGGMVMVQDPKTAKFDGMPRHAIDTGLADYILPPDRMPEQLINYINRLPEPLVPSQQPNLLQQEGQLQTIFKLLRQQTGHDFSQYKRNTIGRRIERRMVTHQIERLEDYVHYLRQNALEVERLFREMLIGVTRFFRDPEAFQLLEEKVLPQLLAGRDAEEPVRVWVPGCSTGEEAYSIAMLLHEQIGALDQPVSYQIFATDIDDKALNIARRALYPPTVAGDMTADRFERFLTENQELYRISKAIRENILFAVQDVISDPHFSQLDLISCRNLLIYLDAELQQKVIPLFHYALKPRGFLFLSSSESLGKSEKYFAVIDRKWKVFQRRGDRSAPESVPQRPVRRSVAETLRLADRSERSLSTLREEMQSLLLERYAPTAVLLDKDGHILYIHGRTGRYLELGTGKMSDNIFHLVRQELEIHLSNGLRQAIAEQKAVTYQKLRLHTDSQTAINLTIRPLPAPQQPALYAVIFEETAILPLLPEDMPGTAAKQRIQELEQELAATKEYLQTTTEDLRSTNEEMQSTNEELFSTNEELEVSQEELQSVNEELLTVNAELKGKINETTQAKTDVSNLMNSLEVGAIFLDLTLNIRRFTPAAQKIVNLIDSDAGRPLKHTVSNLVNVNLTELAEQILNTLNMVQQVVQTKQGDWYWMQIRPYRAHDNVVEGITMTFIDANALNLAQAQRDLMLKLSQNINAAPHYEAALQSTLDTICQQTQWALAESWLPDRNNLLLETNITSQIQAKYEDQITQFWQTPTSRTFSPGQGLPGRVWVSQEPLWIEDVSQLSGDDYPRIQDLRQAGLPLRAVLGVPIVAEGNVLAVLTFYEDQSRAVDAKQVQMITAVAGQLGTLFRQKQEVAWPKREE